MRKVLVVLCVAALTLLPGCSHNRTPSSPFEAAGYHVTDDAVYYLNAFPGNAFQIEEADVGSFEVFDESYARDAANVYLDGAVLTGADTTTFQPLERPGFAKDAHHVYRRGVALSSDPAHFELLDGEMAKDRAAVYWSDGSVLSHDPAHFVIISNVDHYLFTKDADTVHVNGTPVSQADPATFRVLNANVECSADARHAYYRQAVIADADPGSFPHGRAATGCSETSITFVG